MKASFIIFFSLFVALAYPRQGLCENDVSKMILAYADLNYKMAFKLAEKNQDTPEGRLIKGLCLINNQHNQDIKQGLAILKKLGQNKATSTEIKVQALFSCARVAQLASERREVFGDIASDIDFIKVYDKVITLSPDSNEASLAVVLMSYPDMFSKESIRQDKAFERIETFCRNFKGDSQLLVPIHLFLETNYIYIRNDYDSSVKHLIAAYELGIENPRDRPIYLYRIARIFDTKLMDQKNALIYYRKFQDTYPESVYIDMVNRFASALQETEK